MNCKKNQAFLLKNLVDDKTYDTVYILRFVLPHDGKLSVKQHEKRLFSFLKY